jgi:flavin-dependent dehydrogenase
MAEGRFSGSGIGVRRTELIDRLALRAQELRAELWFGVPVEDWVEKDDRVTVRTPVADVTARYLVGADGLHSRIRRKAGLDSRGETPPRYGIRRHYRVMPWSNLVEVHWADDVEAYVTPIGEDEVAIAMLYRGDGRSFDDLVERFPDLKGRLDGGTHIGRDRGAGPLRQRAKHVTSGHIALVGDAAGYIDAITGEGVTLAFETASALVDTLSSGLPLRTYRRRYARITRTYRWLTRTLLEIASRKATRRRIVRSLARSPKTFDRFVEAAAGERSIREIGLTSTLRLISGMMS